ncbi:MAG: hypothetical protein RIR91_730 [Verrucomicrobiota bacterium]
MLLGAPPKPLPIAQTEQVLGTVVALLDRELGRAGHPRRAELVRSAALHLSLLKDGEEGLIYRDKRGAWCFLSGQRDLGQVPLGATDVLRPIKVVQPESLPRLLRELPEEFRFYIRSLTLERADAVALCDALLHLPPTERRNLSALAAYRKARLKMALSGDLDEDGGAEHLQEVRRDLQQVKQLIAEGAPAIAHLDLATDGWLAQTYLYGTSDESAYDPEDPEVDAARALRMYVQLYRQGDARAGPARCLGLRRDGSLGPRSLAPEIGDGLPVLRPSIGPERFRGRSVRAECGHRRLAQRLAGG